MKESKTDLKLKKAEEVAKEVELLPDSPMRSLSPKRPLAAPEKVLEKEEIEEHKQMLL